MTKELAAERAKVKAFETREPRLQAEFESRDRVNPLLTDVCNAGVQNDADYQLMLQLFKQHKAPNGANSPPAATLDRPSTTTVQTGEPSPWCVVRNSPFKLSTVLMNSDPTEDRMPAVCDTSPVPDPTAEKIAEVNQLVKAQEKEIQARKRKATKSETQETKRPANRCPSGQVVCNNGFFSIVKKDKTQEEKSESNEPAHLSPAESSWKQFKSRQDGAEAKKSAAQTIANSLFGKDGQASERQEQNRSAASKPANSRIREIGPGREEQVTFSRQNADGSPT